MAAAALGQQRSAGEGGSVRRGVLGARAMALGAREREEICFKSKALFPS